MAEVATTRQHQGLGAGSPDKANYKVLNRLMIKFAVLFIADIRESYEMLYQNDTAYVFDSSKFSKAFNMQATTYASGIQLTAAACAKR